ncbi:MAG: hypothetical protein AAF211_01385, partial [Myxococcota bacterium]
TEGAVVSLGIADDGAVTFAIRTGRVSVLDARGDGRWSTAYEGPVHLDVSGDQLALVEGGSLAIHDMASGASRWRFDVGSEARRVRWSPAGDAVVLACTDGTVRVVDAGTGEVRTSLRLPTGPAWDAAVAPVGDRLAVAGRALYLAEGAQDWQVVPLTSAGRVVAWSPDGTELAVGTAKGGVVRVDPARRALTRHVESSREVIELAWGDRGIRWATGFRVTRGSTVDVAGSVLHVAAGESAHTLVTASGIAEFDLAGAPNRTVAMAEPVRGVGSWSAGVLVHTAHRLATSDGFETALPVAMPDAVAVGSPDRIATAEGRAPSVSAPRTLSVRVWDVESGQPRHMEVAEPQGLAVDQLAMDPDEGWVAARIGSRVVVWSTVDGGRRVEYDGVQPSVRGLHSTASGGRLVSAMGDGTVHLWRPEPGEPRVLPTGDVTALALDPTGTRLAVGIRGPRHAAVQTWNTQSGGKICAALPDVEGHVVRVACAEGARRVAALLRRAGANEVYVWDGIFGVTLARLRAKVPLSALALSTDGARLVVGARDGGGGLWRLDALDQDEVTDLVWPAS